jgi:putative ABC transport system permease protein
VQPPTALRGLLRGTLTMSQGAPKALAMPVAQLVERLRAEPEVAEVTISKSFPGYEQYTALEVETDAQNTLSMNAYTNRVAANTFGLFDVPLLAGRAFTTADEREGSTTAIIDQTFAEKLGGGNVVGRRVRYLFESDGQTKHSEWFEIVGVVPAFSRTFKPSFGLDAPLPRIFHASAPGNVYPATIVVRVNGTAAERFAPKLIDIAATVDPRLRVEKVEGVVEAWKHEQSATRMIAFSIIAVVGAVLLLSAAGIYAMMSFTVASRRREIGIRAALGANPRGISRRSVLQSAAWPWNPRRRCDMSRARPNCSLRAPSAGDAAPPARSVSESPWTARNIR